MKRLTILALFLFPSVVCAQQRTAAISPESFEKRAEFSAAAFDIVWARPRHMIDLDTLAGQWIRRGHRSGTAYAPVLESENGEFILMYLSFLIYRTEGEIEIDQTMRKLEKSPPTNELLTNDNYPRLLITGGLRLYGRLFQPGGRESVHPGRFRNLRNDRFGRQSPEVVQCRLGVPVHPAGGRSVQKGLHALHGYDRL